MNPAEYEKMHRLEQRYWWFVGRRRLVLRLIRRFGSFLPRNPVILDVGCGTGATAQELAEFGTVTAVDISEEALGFTLRRGVPRLVCANAQNLPFADSSFDLVTALDVLEHLDNDCLGASEVRRVMKPGGLLIATVPALQVLWSRHDVALHHYRRYTRAQFRQLLTSCGLRVLKLSYCMTALFPLVLAARMAERALPHRREASTTLPEVGGLLNWALTSLLEAEAETILRTNLPIGVSLVCVARKEEQ